MNESNRIESFLMVIAAVMWGVETFIGLTVVEGSSGVLRLYVSKKLCKDGIRVERMDASATPGSFDTWITFCFS